MSNVAIVGAGRIGTIHAANARAHPELQLRYVVDAVDEVAEALAAKTGAQAARFEDVLADPEIAGVIVASSTETHLDYSVRAIQAGRAVFCEKPLDFDIARARSVANVLGEGAKFFLGFNRRFDPNFNRLHDTLAAGEFGALETLHIISHDPSPPPIAYVKVSGGLFFDMAIHDFDMARWLLGEEPVEIYAAGECLVDPAIGEAGDIDTAKCILRTASGKLCVISNSRRSGYGYDQRIEAFCAKGVLRANNIRVTSVEAWTEAGGIQDPLQTFFLDRYHDAYIREMDHFASILAGSALPLVGYSDGIAAMAIARRATESQQGRKLVRID